MNSPNPTTKPAFAAQYFDGVSGKPMPCHIWFEGNGNSRKLVIQLEPSQDLDAVFSPLTQSPLAAPIAPQPQQLRFKANRISWPETTSSPHRQMHLPTGASLSTSQGAALDAWLTQQGIGQTWIAHWQQRWHWAAASLALLVALVAAAYQWGVPWAATAVLTVIPQSVDAQVGDSALELYDARMLKPSQLNAAKQRKIRTEFAEVQNAAFLKAGSPRDWPPYTLHFRDWQGGPNAFALPGGNIVMTDALVDMADTDIVMVTAVLAHEYGHVLHRHSMHNLVRVSLLSVGSAVLFGDVNSVLSTAPLLLGQMHYSRQFERQADAVAADMLIAAKESPLALARFFETLAKDVSSQDSNPSSNERTSPKTGLDEESLGIAISSHPSDSERIAYFQRRAQEAGFSQPE